MADAVARARKAQAVLFGNGLDIAMVVSVLEAVLKRVVIYVRHRKLGLDAFDSHCFKLEIGHRARCVLCKGLVDLQRNLVSRRHPRR